MLAVKKVMLESLLNLRFRGTTLRYEEILMAFEKTSSLTTSLPSRQPDRRRSTRVPQLRLDWPRRMKARGM